ncbi:ATP-binding protein [Candidatus Methylospira mobilis]|uniref:ATP-binding protein n=1 Tax=Candidatus Methylospira mobilis TaxID=1808979 RepID=UPI00387E6114
MFRARSYPGCSSRSYRARGPSLNRKNGGAGLGLAICRNITEAYAGSIVANASSLGGLRVKLHFPALIPDPIF